MLSAAALRKMLDLGLTLEQAVELAEVWEAGAVQPVPELSRGALRTRKWREKNAERHRDVTVTSPETETPPPPSFPPEPPKPPTPTRECVSSRAHEEAAFARFWAAYPRKTAKADARKAFAKAWRKLDAEDGEQALTGGLERAKAAWTDAQFIPHPATWLNGERWNDEPPPPPQPRQAHERPNHDAKFDRKQANLARAFTAPGRVAGQRWEP